MDSERLLIIAFVNEHPAEAARLLERLPSEEAAALLADIPADAASEVLRRMSAFGASTALVAMESNSAAAVLALIPLQDTASLLRRIEPALRESLTAALADEARNHVRVLLRYPEQTAGALMDPLVLVLPDDLSVLEKSYF